MTCLLGKVVVCSGHAVAFESAKTWRGRSDDRRGVVRWFDPAARRVRRVFHLARVGLPRRAPALGPLCGHEVRRRHGGSSLGASSGGGAALLSGGSAVLERECLANRAAIPSFAFPRSPVRFPPRLVSPGQPSEVGVRVCLAWRRACVLPFSMNSRLSLQCFGRVSVLGPV